MKKPNITIAIDKGEIIAFEPNYMEVSFSLGQRIYKLMAGMYSKKNWDKTPVKVRKEHTAKARKGIK